MNLKCKLYNLYSNFLGATEPLNLDALNKTGKSLTFTWDQPDIVEGIIIGYTVECRKGRYEILSNTCATNCTNTVTVLGLAPNSRYWCKVIESLVLIAHFINVNIK